ncbi:hypothetical protein Nepgr_026451 [Nepenthes gracilis]|uniref:LOB domain-containing protein n=1 Tax=Nepenthes gracilis TaxID=150966 RepID=A0AAD3T853_NEPGR|nr:hypothetical protein Nepgr_026451 [Nepenthes gracilis]
MSSSNSPCAACKFLRRKCTQECVFAPYFPPDQPQKFASVHKVFGASNVAKLLNELHTSQREDAVNSLAYEAEARLRDPVYGCVGLISILQHRLKQVKADVNKAKLELANYIGPSAMMPIFHPGFLHQHPGNPSSSLMQYNMPPMVGIPAGLPHMGPLVITDPQQQQQAIHHHHLNHQYHHMIEAQHLAAMAVREEQEMMRTFEEQQHRHQHQQQLVRFDGGYELADPVSPATAATAVGGFNHMTAASAVSPSLALGGNFDNSYQIQQQPEEHEAPLLLLQQPLTPPQHHTEEAQPIRQQLLPLAQQPTKQEQMSGSEDGGTVGPSC